MISGYCRDDNRYSLQAAWMLWETWNGLRHSLYPLGQSSRPKTHRESRPYWARTCLWRCTLLWKPNNIGYVGLFIIHLPTVRVQNLPDLEHRRRRACGIRCLYSHEHVKYEFIDGSGINLALYLSLWSLTKDRSFEAGVVLLPSNSIRFVIS